MMIGPDIEEVEDPYAKVDFNFLATPDKLREQDSYIYPTSPPSLPPQH